MSTVRYSSNNSGGDWWLSDKDWYALEEAGWDVDWASEGRWLGALATRATRDGLTLEAAKSEFGAITGEDPGAEGCSCCGQPHYFSEAN